MTEVKRFVINRNVWLRGDANRSRLLDPESRKQCCVGIYLSACGLTDDALEEYAQAEDVTEDGVPDWLFRGEDPADDGPARRPSPVASILYSVNDDSALSEEMRESRVAHHFASQGITVEFTG